MKIKILQNSLIALALTFGVFTGAGMAKNPTDIAEQTVTLSRTGETLVSPTFTFDRPFNAVSLELPQVEPGLMVDFGDGWEEVENHDDGFGPEAFLLTSPVTSLRFKKPADMLEESLTFDLDVFFREGTPVAGLDGRNLLAGTEVAFSADGIISRAEWGADETMRYWSPDAPHPNAGSSNDEGGPCSETSEKYPNEVGIERTVGTGPAGDPLIWSLQYSKSIQKIIVHHTDSEIRDVDGDNRINTRDYKEIVRAIYRFHTVTRGWGDIGYNFIIDPLGNVYEGRFGGDKVIGAHALCHNNGSVGIAVIGDYQDNNVPEPAMDSLVSLIGYETKKYRLDPEGESPFRGKSLPNILGHKDVRPTACPGQHLYGALPDLRNKTGLLYRGQNFQQNLSAQTLDYNADSLSTPENLRLRPNERKKIILQFKNTGTQFWDQNTWLHVALNNNPNARVVPLLPDKNFVAGNLREYRVGPGGVGSFEMELEAGYVAGDYEFEVSPVVNGRYKVSRAAMRVPFSVEEPRFDYAFVQAELPSGVIFQSQQIDAWVDLKNNGNVTWRNYGPNQITLGTENPRDHKSLFKKENPARLGYLIDSEVPPGGTGRFAVELDVPLRLEGPVTESFTPVIEGVRWLENKGLGFTATLKRPVHLARVTRVDPPAELLPGEMKKLTVRLENKGDLPWNEENMYVSLTGHGIKVFKTKITPRDVSVRKGQTVDLDFWVQAPYEGGSHSVSLSSRYNRVPIKGGSTRFVIRVPEPNLRAQMVSQSERSVQLQPNEIKEVSVTFKNTGNTLWTREGTNALHLATAKPEDRKSLMYYKPEWISPQRAAEMKEEQVRPNETATFTFKVRSDRQGVRREYFQLVSEKVGWITGGTVRWDFRVFGERVENPYALDDAKYNKQQAAQLVRSQTNPVTTPSTTTERQVVYKKEAMTDSPIRIRLSYNAEESSVTANSAFAVVNGNGNALFQVDGGSPVLLKKSGDKIQITVADVIRTVDAVRLVPAGAGIIQLQTWERRPAWNQSLNDNEFRGTLEVRLVDGAMAYINELPLEDYMKGLAEVSNSTLLEKQKAIAVLARTYARFYLKPENRKFPGKPYDGSDDPAVFQRYLGYGVEKRSPNFVAAVALTENEVVTYRGTLVKTPYFSQSDGRTKSAEEVWGWTDTPYLKAVPDPWCEGKTQEGHGVGLSGCGADAQAAEGKTYDDIIKYYYQGVEVEELKFEK